MSYVSLRIEEVVDEIIIDEVEGSRVRREDLKRLVIQLYRFLV